MSSPASLFWLAFLMISQVSSVCWLCLHRSPLHGEDTGSGRRRALAATTICSTSSAFMDLAAKGWSSCKAGPFRVRDFWRLI